MERSFLSRFPANFTLSPKRPVLKWVILFLKVINYRKRFKKEMYNFFFFKYKLWIAHIQWPFKPNWADNKVAGILVVRETQDNERNIYSGKTCLHVKKSQFRHKSIDGASGVSVIFLNSLRCPQIYPRCNTKQPSLNIQKKRKTLCYPYHLLCIIFGLLVGPVHSKFADIQFVTGIESAGDLYHGPIQCIDLLCHMHFHGGDRRS